MTYSQKRKLDKPIRNYKLELDKGDTASPELYFNNSTANSYIYSDGNDLKFYDSTTGSEVTLDSLSSGAGNWTDSGAYLKPGTDGEYVRLYDAGGTDYLTLQHDGTDGIITTNAGDLTVSSAAQIELNSATEVNAELTMKSGNDIVMKNSDGTEYARIEKDAGLFSISVPAGDGRIDLQTADSDIYLVTGVDADIWLGEHNATTYFKVKSDVGSLVFSVRDDGLVDLNEGNIIEFNYINGSGTSGSGGYGLRDNSGTIEYKNSGGSWAGLSSGGGNWTDAGNYLKPNTNGDDVRVYHTNGSDYMELKHNGSNAEISTNTGNLYILDHVDVRDGKYIYARNSGNTEYMYMFKGNTYGAIVCYDELRLYSYDSKDICLYSDNDITLDADDITLKLGGDVGSYDYRLENNSGLYVIHGDGTRDVDIGNDLDVGGALSKGSGSFKIDHPLDPKHKILKHSFIESPEMLNAYRVTVLCDTEVEIELPDYFWVLNENISASVTPISELALVCYEVKDKKVIVKSSVPVKVSCVIYGVRKDRFAKARPIIVEEDKDVPGYLHPDLWHDIDDNPVQYLKNQ